MAARPLKILLVENHDDTLVCLTAYLESCGHRVRSAGDVETALQSLAATPVDVLISDIGLPNGDGWQLMRRLAERKVAVPFGIAMSGYGRPSDLAKSRRAGYRHHLAKPFLPEELEPLLIEAAADAENFRPQA